MSNPPCPTCQRLRGATLAAYDLIVDEFGQAVRNGYFPAVKPVIEQLRAALAVPATPPEDKSDE